MPIEKPQQNQVSAPTPAPIAIEEEQIDTITQKLEIITEQIQQLNSKFDNFTLEINLRLDIIDPRIEDLMTELYD